MTRRFAAVSVALLTVAACWSPARAQDDPYETYVKTSRDFQRVKQDKEWALKAWPSWVYMPWTYKWGIGYDDASGKWSLEHGYNGAFLDHGRTRVGGVDKLAWINEFKLRFYVDHTAGKGDLHLKGRGGGKLPTTGLRTFPVNHKMVNKLRKLIRSYIGNVKSSPWRSAYALDDEISWGSFVKPCMWRITDDRKAYEAWLKEVYGGSHAPDHTGWISYSKVLPQLKRWAVKDFDCSQLMDQWTFNDSYWCNFLGDLVAYANTIDPDTPCGFVGGQSPNAFGGFDYAKVMRKIQFIEAYNIGDSQSVIRSFNPRNALPTVTTHFHKNVRDTVWQTWYYLAHGNRGFIGWVEGWFDGKDPKPWHEAVAPAYREAGSKIGPLMSGAEWIHDGVALYYSQPSIQLGWILDAECHGSTWRNRFSDSKLGANHLVRHAWENMLRDEGIQYNYLSYVDLIRKGVPAEYKVLILPASIALSDVEARRIKEFCRAGGTVIADYMPGLWDQHGRGRADGGCLDEMFGVKHDPNMTAGDVFQTRLWAEADQDAHYNYKSYDELLGGRNTCVKDASGFNKAVRKMDVNHVATCGKGAAVLMNLSPQWYNAYRVRGARAAKKREVFVKHVRDAGVSRWVKITGASAEQVHGYEITYWKQGDRTILFVDFVPELRVTSLGGGNAATLKTNRVGITLQFAGKVRNAKDERDGRNLGDGDHFQFSWPMNEAVVMSFEGAPPR